MFDDGDDRADDSPGLHRQGAVEVRLGLRARQAGSGLLLLNTAASRVGAQTPSPESGRYRRRPCRGLPEELERRHDGDDRAAGGEQPAEETDGEAGFGFRKACIHPPFEVVEIVLRGRPGATGAHDISDGFSLAFVEPGLAKRPGDVERVEGGSVHAATIARRRATRKRLSVRYGPARDRQTAFGYGRMRGPSNSGIPKIRRVSAIGNFRDGT